IDNISPTGDASFLSKSVSNTVDSTSAKADTMAIADENDQLQNQLVGQDNQNALSEQNRSLSHNDASDLEAPDTIGNYDYSDSKAVKDDSEIDKDDSGINKTDSEINNTESEINKADSETMKSDAESDKADVESDYSN